MYAYMACTAKIINLYKCAMEVKTLTLGMLLPFFNPTSDDTDIWRISAYEGVYGNVKDYPIAHANLSTSGSYLYKDWGNAGVAK